MNWKHTTGLVIGLLAALGAEESRAASVGAAELGGISIFTPAPPTNGEVSFQAFWTGVDPASARVAWSFQDDQPNSGLSLALTMTNISTEEWTDFHFTLVNETSTANSAFIDFDTDVAARGVLSATDQVNDKLDLFFDSAIGFGESFTLTGTMTLEPLDEIGTFLITSAPSFEQGPSVIIPSVTALPAGLTCLGLFAMRRRSKPHHSQANAASSE